MYPFSSSKTAAFAPQSQSREYSVTFFFLLFVGILFPKI